LRVASKEILKNKKCSTKLEKRNRWAKTGPFINKPTFININVDNGLKVSSTKVK